MSSLLRLGTLVVLAGCASKLPPSHPMQVTMRPDANPFTGDRCHVFVEPLRFDAAANWGGSVEGAYVASLSPSEQSTHEVRKQNVSAEYAKHLAVNERDYIKDKGSVSMTPGRPSAFVLRSKVTDVNTSTGELRVVHEVFSVPEERKVGEFNLSTQNVGFSVNQRMRTATIEQAWTVLAYFADRFPCTGPARVKD